MSRQSPSNAMPANEILREAMLAHRAGRVTAAEVGYRRVLRQRPDEPRALHFLGLIHFHRGDVAGGLEHVSEALRHDANDARRWNDYGGMLIAAGRVGEAQDAYRKATQVAPAVAEGWYNLGICLRDEGNFEHSADALRQATHCDPQYARAYEALAMLFYQLGRTQDAADVYAQWAAHEPENEKARHLAAAGQGRDVPARASDAYVREHFDHAAETFDDNVAQLEYRVPALLATALIDACSPATSLDTLLDAGCGTGLCGPELESYVRALVGVDLSARMIEQARARGCYTELHVGEITEFMRSRPGAFDAIVCADTLVYFGALESAFDAAFVTLRPTGLFAFTVEDMAGIDSGADAQAERAGETPHLHTSSPYLLELHGRYVHSEKYVREALSAAGFDLQTLERMALRQERSRDVAGLCIIARRRTRKTVPPSSTSRNEPA